ncbi:hypothetical protein DM02DRAFT_722633 [Periconia macrospinosa]|uniref:WW domain-containing protein n=1 Tax=Periconia macrospinosa TaxID=97972 RepID=A0A2V1EE00_9PLEO|nr:hypothetical protein DM02DRAFT_722633 [Periconia macrospinosa]
MYRGYRTEYAGAGAICHLNNLTSYCLTTDLGLRVHLLEEKTLSTFPKHRDRKAIPPSREDYETLDEHVRFLHLTLKEAEAFVSEGNVPEVQNECASLLAAKQTCSATLEELDAFLKRHAGVLEKSRKRKFELAKFILKDISSLKTKLDYSTKFLQLSLQSLQIELKHIVHEYRTGAREPTVVSQAIFSNAQAETGTINAELTQQIHADLEDKDIHPESISLNSRFIQNWLETVLEDGGLEESVDMFEKNLQLEHALNPNATEPAHLSATTQAAVPHDEISDDRSVSHDYQEILQILPAHVDGARGLEVDDDFSRPPSRAESVSSHRSKPDDWRPYDTPNPAWVRNMLLPLFNRDPFLDEAETSADLRIKRAFHQQDYDRKGAIADHRVLRLCEELVESTGSSRRFDVLKTAVYSVDSDGNGQFDEAEYMTLMQILITMAMDAKKETLRRALKDYAEKSEKPTPEAHANTLPWGWRTLKNADQLVYYDMIANSIQTSAPPLPTSSFTVMVEEARIAIKKIDDFEERWVGMVPKEPKRLQDFKDPLKIARDLAYRFLPLENQKNREASSDLDTMFCFSQILSFSSVESEKEICLPLELWQISEYAFSTLRLLQGFVFVLETISRELGSNDGAHRYIKLNEKLRNYQVFLLSKQLALQTSEIDWNRQITEKVDSYRSAHNTSFWESLEPRCKLLASRYYNRLVNSREEAKDQLLNWKVTFEKVAITNWTMSRSKRFLDSSKKVWVRIYIVNGTIRKVAANIPPSRKRAENLSWELDHCQPSLSSESSISVEVGYEGEDKAVFTSSLWELSSWKNHIIDFEQRTLKSDRFTFSNADLLKDRPIMHIALTVRFEDEQWKAQKYNEVKEATWMDLLDGKYLEGLGDFDDPKWDKRATGNELVWKEPAAVNLPPGFETRITPDGRVYYVDHSTHTTSWVAPSGL